MVQRPRPRGGKEPAGKLGWFLAIVSILIIGGLVYFLLNADESDPAQADSLKARHEAFLDELRADEAQDMAGLSAEDLSYIARSVDTVYDDLGAILGTERGLVDGLGSAGQTLTVVVLDDWHEQDEETRLSMGSRLHTAWAAALEAELTNPTPRVHIINGQYRSLAFADDVGGVILFTRYW